jgi:hypothetical protein
MKCNMQDPNLNERVFCSCEECENYEICEICDGRDYEQTGGEVYLDMYLCADCAKESEYEKCDCGRWTIDKVYDIPICNECKKEN